MNKQKQYFINGIILIIMAIVAISFMPYLADKFKLPFEKSCFPEFEFFALTGASLFYLFSPKYYKAQILSILCAILYYFIFLKIYPII